jgi:hypothetical protein
MHKPQSRICISDKLIPLSFLTTIFQNPSPFFLSSPTIHGTFPIPVTLPQALPRPLQWRAKGLEVLVHHILPRTFRPLDRHRIRESSLPRCHTSLQMAENGTLIHQFVDVYRCSAAHDRP